MKERPVLFSAPMVRAILAGTKTQTRRLPRDRNYVLGREDRGRQRMWMFDVESDREGCLKNAPYKAGDRLWVRETFAHNTDRNGLACVVYRADMSSRAALYEDDGQGDFSHVGEYCDGPSAETLGALTWKPSIFMPRRASRITLEVTSVRIERLNDISNDDAMAEGMNGPMIDRELDAIVNQIGVMPATAFRDLWNAINGDRAPWSSNPWVFAIGFRRVTP